MVEIRISCNATNSQRVDSTTFVSKNLKDVGLKATPAPVPHGLLQDMMVKTFDFDAMVLGWQPDPPPGPGTTRNILLSSALNHVSFPLQQTPSTEWEARIDDLVFQITSSADETHRKRLYALIQRIWSEQLPEINLVSQREAIAYKAKFGNIHPSPLQPRVTWNIDEIYVKR